MGRHSFKELCETGLRLDSIGEEILKGAARNILTECDEWFPEQGNRDEQGTYDSDTLHQLATVYIEEGWNSDKLKLSPGKSLWTSSDIDSSKRVYTYPQDKEP